MENHVDLISLQKEKEKLEQRIEQIQKSERTKKISEIKEIMQAYGITLQDLQSASRKPSVLKKYRDDESDNTWGGKGKKPLWLVKKLEQGRKLEEFLVQE